MSSEIRQYVQNNRRDFDNPPIEIESLASNPFKQFEIWFTKLIEADIPEPYAFTLATANAQGQPSVRVVYMRDITESGLVFYTNYGSRKGRDISENPKASANFFWQPFTQQVRFSGQVELLNSKKSDAYFASRPRESQLGAYASQQSQNIADRSELNKKLDALRSEFDGQDIPRPSFWGGYILSPLQVEFWQGRPSRLHDRIVYVRKTQKDSEWTKYRLAP